MNLAQGALEQLQGDLYEFFRVDVYHDHYAGDALSAMGWLDTLDDAGGPGDPELGFGFPVAGAVHADGLGTVASPRVLTLPSGVGRAWVVAVAPTGGLLDPRDVTIEATAAVGGVTKRIRATYRFALAASDIFRYAYFINNYGWFNFSSPFSVRVDGEVRSNGDFRFSGDTGTVMRLNGDVFASQNDELTDPTDPLSGPAQGLIYGDPYQDSLSWYFHSKKEHTRPERRKTFPGMPTVGGGPAELLPYGQGWDTRDARPVSATRPDQQRFDRQLTQDIPYLGDLNLYKTFAREHGGGFGSTLSFATPGPDGLYGSFDDGEAIVNAVHAGSTPLVIIGTADHPIRIDGPIVVEGDVIIKGVVRGRGTIYAGRNVHIVGDIRYSDLPIWPSLERDSVTGQIRAEHWLQTAIADSDLGSVCIDGTYVPNTVTPVSSRCP
jgi:hypothetical protein